MRKTLSVDGRSAVISWRVVPGKRSEKVICSNCRQVIDATEIHYSMDVGRCTVDKLEWPSFQRRIEDRRKELREEAADRDHAYDDERMQKLLRMIQAGELVNYEHGQCLMCGASEWDD